MFARSILQRSIGVAKTVNVKASTSSIPVRYFSALPTKITNDYGSTDGKKVFSCFLGYKEWRMEELFLSL